METIFPVGWTFTYDAQAGGATWTSTVTFTSATQMQLTDWDAFEQGTIYPSIELTKDTFSIDQGKGLQPQFKLIEKGQTWTFTADDGSTGTATVQAILNNFEVPAGTFNNVYQVYYESYKVDSKEKHMNQYMYWKPGLGLLKVEDYGLDPDTTHTLTAYATPLPAGVWLLGSGLLGLAALRRFRKR